jgi:hypothetical protein
MSAIFAEIMGYILRKLKYALFLLSFSSGANPKRRFGSRSAGFWSGRPTDPITSEGGSEAKVGAIVE